MAGKTGTVHRQDGHLLGSIPNIAQLEECVSVGVWVVFVAFHKSHGALTN